MSSQPAGLEMIIWTQFPDLKIKIV